MKPPIVALLALLLATTGFVVCREAAAAADPVVTDQRVEAPDHLTVGDHLRYVITVEADKGTTVSLAANGLPAELALVAAPQTSSRSIAGGRVQLTLTLEVAPFVPGQLSIDPLQLGYRSASGANGTLTTPASSLNVESVLPASGDLAPRELKPQAEIGATGSSLLEALIAGAALAIVLIAGLVLRRRQSRKRRLSVVLPEPAPVALSPEDVARGRLDRTGSDFEASRDYAAYYSVIAETVRSYLTQRFGFPAFALTTRELQDEMVRRGVDRWQARVAGGLLSQCDAVVYARYEPAHERADADLTAAYEIVEISRPEPLPEAVGVP